MPSLMVIWMKKFSWDNQLDLWANLIQITCFNYTNHWGFCGSKADASMFIYKDKCSLVICLIYVDDILMTGNNPSLLQHFISELNVCFSLKDLGSISYFLGVQVTYQPGFLHLSWSKYISDLLKRADMVNCKPIHTPMVACAQLSLNDPPLDDPTTYWSLVGALHYCTLTRPSISFSINKLCQFLHAPKTTHMQAVKHLLRYLKGVSSLGLTSLNPLIGRLLATRMLIGLVVQMIGVVVSVYSLVQIWSHGNLPNSMLFPAHVSNLNTEGCQMLLQKLCRLNPFFLKSALYLALLLLSFAIIWVLPTLLLIVSTVCVPSSLFFKNC